MVSSDNPTMEEPVAQDKEPVPEPIVQEDPNMPLASETGMVEMPGDDAGIQEEAQADEVEAPKRLVITIGGPGLATANIDGGNGGTTSVGSFLTATGGTGGVSVGGAGGGYCAKSG